jgi:DNA mismatch repair protein MutS
VTPSTEPRPAAAPDDPLRERLDNDNLTPMMRQYMTVKAAHPGAIVLFRMGDFFETFFEDAETCARLLDIVLTARSKEKDVKMAGVPHHAVDGYLARLIDAGQTVVVVDQVEDPKLAKGLVRREVTRILTPGTFLDPGANPRSAHYLSSLSFGGRSARARKMTLWGLAVLDLSTGEFRATSGEDDDLLFEEIARTGARELLVDARFAEDPRIARVRREMDRMTITLLDPDRYAAGPSIGRLAARIGEAGVVGARTAMAEPAIVAAGAALIYAEAAELPPEAKAILPGASLDHIHSLRPYLPSEGLVVDQQAREHLELFYARGDGDRSRSLLGVLDRAVTAMGGRTMAAWLAYPLRDPPAIRARQDAVAALVSVPSALDRLRDGLAAVADLERLIGRVVMGRAVPRDLVLMRRTLASAPAVLAAAAEAAVGPTDRSFEQALAGPTVESARLAVLAGVDPCTDLSTAIERALLDDPSNDLESASIFRPGYDAALDEVVDVATNGKTLIANLEAKEKDETKIGSLKVRYNSVFGYFIEVTKPNLKLVPAHYRRKQTVANAERFYTEELKELETKVLTAEEKQVERTKALFTEMTSSIAVHAKRLRALAEALAELDVLGALAHVASKRSWVRPLVDERGSIEIADGRHPVLEVLADELGERFVPNDISISDEQRLVIITGPNMAGKSTIMRQTALIAILAHMGSFVPASTAKIGVLDRIFTRVGASDDLSRGRSTFMVEMSETARILRSATSRSLILLDEIGRGTSTFDGLSIAWAVAEHIHDHVGAKTLFATHYHELTELTRDKPRAVNRHVAVKEWNEQIVFLRKLLAGPTNRSYGVQVARLAGLPAEVVDRAREVLDSLEAQALVAGDASAVAHLVRVRAAGLSEGEQLHLFQGASKTASDEVLARLRTTAIDDLSPRQAHALLAELIARLEET